MAPATEADNNFDTHEWKSEFASTRSGRNSPNIFAKVRRKLLLTPPVRNARSPRLTEEELDALTGDLYVTPLPLFLIQISRHIRPRFHAHLLGHVLFVYFGTQFACT